MKRMIVVLMLLTIIVASLIKSISYVKETCNTTGELLEKCITAYENNENSKAKAQELHNYWSDKEAPLSFIVNHERIDEIEKAIGSLLDYSDTSENEIFHEYSGEVKTLIHQLLEDTLVGVHSIF